MLPTTKHHLLDLSTNYRQPNIRQMVHLRLHLHSQTELRRLCNTATVGYGKYCSAPQLLSRVSGATIQNGGVAIFPAPIIEQGLI